MIGWAVWHPSSLGVNLPRWVSGTVRAREATENGGVRFEVVAELLVIGPLFRYAGWIGTMEWGARG